MAQMGAAVEALQVFWFGAYVAENVIVEVIAHDPL
jgi:hypothetical protein